MPIWRMVLNTSVQSDKMAVSAPTCPDFNNYGQKYHFLVIQSVDSAAAPVYIDGEPRIHYRDETFHGAQKRI
jgi:hypothetical protein